MDSQRIASSMLVCMFALSVIGCATQPKESYSERLAEMPMPTDAASTQQQCSWVRSEIARMENIEAMPMPGANPYLAAGLRAKANRDIADLESRAAAMRCAAAFSSQAALPSTDPAAPANPIAQCVAACKTNTSRTGAECFDDCNHH